VREEHRLRLHENRVLRKIFGSEKEEVAGSWRRLHNEELRNLCSLPNITRVIMSVKMRLVEHVERLVEMRNPYKIFIGKLGETTRRK
jgi:hypothetical protein